MLKPALNPLIVFIHGLNTFGDSNFHAGPLTLGPMSAAWRPVIESQGWEFFAARDVGYDSFEQQITRVLVQLADVLDGKNADGKTAAETSSVQLPRDIHFLGHSMGGLISRGVAEKLRADPRVRVRSVITMGSPHGGTLAAEGALDLQMNAPRFHALLARFGYDIEKRREPLSHLRLERILDFSAKHPSVERGYSLVGSVPFLELGWPFQAIYRHLHKAGEPSDGIVWAENQKWAHVAGEFALDHFGLLGAFWQVNPLARLRAHREFARAAETVQDIIRTNSVGTSALRSETFPS